MELIPVAMVERALTLLNSSMIQSFLPKAIVPSCGEEKVTFAQLFGVEEIKKKLTIPATSVVPKERWGSNVSLGRMSSFYFRSYNSNPYTSSALSQLLLHYPHLTLPSHNIESQICR